jgi:hypothetical protein
MAKLGKQSRKGGDPGENRKTVGQADKNKPIGRWAYSSNLRDTNIVVSR